MIAEVLTRKVAKPFKGLADYLNGKPGRVETSFFLNTSFDAFDLNLKEIKAFQTVAKSEADKTYHFVISLREGEKLNDEEIKRAVNMHLKALGFEKHHALVTSHNDTANFHIHVAVNKVCPETGKTITPYKDYEKLDQACVKLEKIFGLQQDNRIGQGTNKTTRLYDGRQSFQEWVTELSPEIMNRLEKSTTWKEFHTELAAYNLCIRQRGAGLVISDLENKLFMKASAVDRKLSKQSLENLFGQYEQPDFKTLPKPALMYEGTPKNVEKNSPLYTKFIETEKVKKQTRNQELALLYETHGKRIIQLKDWYNTSKTDLEKDWLLSKKERNKVLFSHRETMKKKLEQYYKDLERAKSQVIQKTSPMGWNTFVLSEAENFKLDAINLLRSKSKRAPFIKDNSISMKWGKLIVPGFDQINRHGEMIYNFGKVQVRDVGDRLSFFGDLSDNEGLAKALKLTSLKKGDNLIVNGSKDFKEKITESIFIHKIDLKPKNLRVQDKGRRYDQGR